jgi:glycosyltransferase involved in cell wall biosynthesis
MTISVAIATYNRAAMVEAAIEAALAQSTPPDEIVVSDDASTDATSAVLARLAARDGRVRVFRQKDHSGGAGNANFAMRHTRGGLIAWCSDDDRFLPGHLEASAAFLETHPEIGLVHSGFVDALERGGRRELHGRPLRSGAPLILGRDSLMPYLIRHYNWPFHPSTLVLRREVWERVGGFDTAYALCDTDWFVRAAEHFRIAMLPRLGVINRRHAGNWSNLVGSARMQREIFEIGEGALSRRWPRPGLRRMLWRAAWRANVRLRLALTLHARLRTAHANPACAAWHGLLQDTGWRAPEWLERAGVWLIRRRCAGRRPEPGDFSPSITPL